MCDIIDFNRESIEEMSRYLGDHYAWSGDHPTDHEILEYMNTVYHWQTMNGLIHKFRLQKFNGEYIFTYSSWNHDIKRSYVFLEYEFRKYLRLMWKGQIKGVIDNGND